MKLFVDAFRDPPDMTWTVARTSAAALEILRSGVLVTDLSLDHDLGGEDTSRPVVLYLAEYGGWPAVVRVHSANPVGVEWLTSMVERYGPGISRRRCPPIERCTRFVSGPCHSDPVTESVTETSATGQQASTTEEEVWSLLI